MELISLNECKEIELEALVFFIDLCEKHQLKYYLAFGTLLGSVRHSGFIPWDDDIDVLMPREDYNRFLEVSKIQQFENWIVLNHMFDERFCYYWTKIAHRHSALYPSRFNNGLIYGLSMDIFPLDFIIGDSVKEVSTRINSIRDEYDKLMWDTGVNVVFSKKIKSKVGNYKRKILFDIYFKHHSNPIDIINSVECKFQSINNSKGNYCYYPMDTYRSIWQSVWFSQSEFRQFEGINCCVPSGYDSVLRECYGDYMVLPPVEKRISNHTYKAYRC